MEVRHMKKQSSLEERALNYGNEIKQIDDFVQQVRQTPDVYIGKVYDNAAFITMIREILQNSIDEILKGNAFSKDIFVTYDERTHQVIVSDNGRGIPHGKIGIIFGTSHTSSNYNKEPYKYSAGKNGCGASVTNALSRKFTVDSYVLGKAKHVEFDEGHIWKKGEVDIKCDGKQGSVISFVPNEDVIGKVTSTWEEVYELIAMIVPTAPIGTHVEYIGIDKNGRQHSETVHNQDGVCTYLIKMTQQPFIEPIVIQNDDGTHKMDVAFTWDVSSLEEIISLNNTCPTPGNGKHVDGALDGITRYFRDHMNKIFLANQKGKNKLTCTFADIRQGLKLAVSTFHLYALYNGQAKEELSNDDMKPFVSQTIISGLKEWEKTHSAELQKLCKYFKEMIEMRCSQDKKKEKIAATFKQSIFSGLPEKYIKPNGKTGIELIIVEGDSAAGSARDSRDNVIQGILPTRGKIPNAFDKPRAELFKNEEISAVIHIIGEEAGIGKNFDIRKCKVERVIIMADADPDGAHIRTLWERFFIRYYPGLIEAGRVFAAIPPLYGIIGKKSSDNMYFPDELSYIKYVQKSFSNSCTVVNQKGKKLTAAEVTKIVYNNANYVEDMNKVANNHAINPYLLEDIIRNRDLAFAKFKSAFKKKYRFLEVIAEGNDKIVIQGPAYDVYNKIFVTPMLMKEASILFKYVDSADEVYNVNGTPMTMYGLMATFNKFRPNNRERFKGLGEMDPEMLAVSTLRPDGDRHLVQYTIDDLEKDLEEMRRINSNKELLLKV